MRKLAVGLVCIAVLAAGAAAVARALEYRGAAKPGVHLLGVDVGGSSRGRIEALLRRWSAKPVTIRTASRSYHVPRGWLVSVDAQRTAKRALAAGSAFSLLVARRVDVEPVVGRAPGAGDVLEALARTGRAPRPATLAIDGADVQVTPARAGRKLDRKRLLALLETGDADVRAPYATLKPDVTTAAANRAAADARALVDAPVALAHHGAQLGSLTRAQLARALHAARHGDGFAVSLDGARLAKLVRPRLGRWTVRARNARFVVQGDTVHVVPSKPGRDVRPAQVARAVAAAARSGGVAELELGPRQAALTTAKANALGIRTKLVSYTTDMGESSSNRIHNVHLMADFIDGTLIRPGETFSFNDVVGPRTAERGFLEGQEIIGSLVLPAIGGGVCQTATTLFNDAFEAGLPILARVNHNLYLAHYPLGRDATVSWGGPDFQFRNDLKHGILIKTSYTDRTLTFTFYGTPEGRRVVSSTSEKTKWTKPGMNYAVDPRAPRGSVEVVKGTGELGFDVSVTRTVYDADGKELRHDLFRSHYIPDSDTTVYGPGKTPPGPYIVLPETT
ncbi:MAG TPA: VanW family protein [Gaiellaceae bacterium]